MGEDTGCVQLREVESEGHITAVYNFLTGGVEWDVVLSSSLLSGGRMQWKMDIDCAPA